MSLLDELVKLSKSDELALHMPGHKRKGIGALKGTEAIDITEIEGYDNLYDAEGILKEAIDRHNKKIPLIVDEAHGAHLSLHNSLPKGALDLKADIVIHSMHKTLRAMTQTALLHVQGDLVDITQVEKYYRIFQTSSPSYVLMASMDEAVCELINKGDILFKRFIDSKGHFLQMIQTLSCLRVIGNEDLKGSNAYALDPCKITVDVTNCQINGYELQRLLLKDYGIQLEMADEDRVVAITTYADSREDLERFALALLSIDDMIKTGRIGIPKGQTQAERAIDKNMYAPCIG